MAAPTGAAGMIAETTRGESVRLFFALLLVLLAIGAAACGGDSEPATASDEEASTAAAEPADEPPAEESPAEDPPAEEPTAEDPVEAVGECTDELQELSAAASTFEATDDLGDLADQLRAIADVAPEEIADDYETLADTIEGFASGDVDALTEYTQAAQNIVTWITENCA
jgi:hypothetical protein